MLAAPAAAEGAAAETTRSCSWLPTGNCVSAAGRPPDLREQQHELVTSEPRYEIALLLG